MKEARSIIKIALGVGIFLMLLKFVAFFITGSNAVLTDAAESIVNVVASGFAFYSIYLASQPRDINHPYGHGKVEFFSVFVEGILILLAGLLILFKSGYNLVFPQQIKELLTGSIILGAAGLVNLGLGSLLIKKGKKLHSLTLQADGKHLQTDGWTSAGLIIGLMLIHFTGYHWLDSVLSILIGLYIIYNGYKLVRKSVGGLMDESDFELVSEVVDLLAKNRRNSWIDVHNLRTQRYGNQLHIDAHMTLPYYFDLNQTHEEVTRVDQLLNSESRLAVEFFIHADPCLPQCCHYCRMENCPVRSEPQSVDYQWDLVNITTNVKHFVK